MIPEKRPQKNQRDRGGKKDMSESKREEKSANYSGTPLVHAGSFLDRYKNPNFSFNFPLS